MKLSLLLTLFDYTKYTRLTLLPQIMISTIEVPHLSKGQKIAEYKKIFKASTAALTDPQRLACLPMYVHRTEGEKQLAFTAATKDTLDIAFKFLEDLIDGRPCIFTESMKFFQLMPKDTSIDGIRSYYFELHEISTRAEITPDVFLKRFLSNTPGGKKLFNEKKDVIKVPNFGIQNTCCAGKYF